MRATQEKHTFYKRYNRIMLGAFISILLLSCAMIFIQIKNSSDAELMQLRENFKTKALALDNLIYSVVEHVSLLQTKAEHFNLYSGDKNDPLYKSLVQHEGYYALDQIPTPFTTEHTGNLTGEGLLESLTEAQQKELRMALSLNAIFQATKHNIESTAWVYYTSKNNFINIYPWVASDKFRFSEELYTHEFYKWGLPEINPDKSLFWTPAYIDEYGMGMMVTAAKPVYDQTRFLGTVSIDITLDQLTDYVKQESQDVGYLIIVNEQDQLLAHPSLVSSKDKSVKSYTVGLPNGLQSGFSVESMSSNIGHLERSESGDYYYSYYQMKNVPWKVIYFIEKKEILMRSLNSIGVLFFTIIVGMGLLFLITHRVTFQEFIDPATKLVENIHHESEKLSPLMPVVPEPWQPWFISIKETFAENRMLLEEIEAKNEMLTERNISIERYMPKFILMLSLDDDAGNAAISNCLASTLAQFENAKKKTVYMSFPEPEEVYKHIAIDREAGDIYSHPNGYDIWTSYQLGSHQNQLKSALLMSKVLNEYDNIVISANIAQDSLTEDLKYLIKYAKAIAIIAPPAEGVRERISNIYTQVKQITNQNKTNLYTVLNRSDAAHADITVEGHFDLEIPYSAAPALLSTDLYEVPQQIKPITDLMVDRLERVHQISIFIPTTIDTNAAFDTSQYVQKTMQLFGERFGGATSSTANGVWNSMDVGLVNETVHIVVTYTTEFGLNQHIDEVIEYVRDLKKELSQEAMAVEIDKKMMLI